MSCVYPIDAWRAATCNESGKRGIVFNPQDGFVDFPLQLPCGHCIGCKLARSRMWTVRMVHEASLHDQNSFVTLTYADAPSVLCKRDLQLFIKRLRKRVAVRYFAVGEYGELSRRPHYHAVVFGADFRGGSVAINETLWTNPILSGIWGHGLVSVGDFSVASAAYVAGYVTKKLDSDEDTFTVMSRRPGVGHGWLEKYADDLRRTGKAVVEGREYAIPKAYFDWTDLENVKTARKRYFSGLTPEERWTRRIVTRAREINFKAACSAKVGKL